MLMFWMNVIVLMFDCVSLMLVVVKVVLVDNVVLISVCWS